MSKRRQDREDRILERYQLENRELKQTVRSLQKKLKALNKGYYKFMVAQDEEQEKEAIEAAKETAKKICWACGTGEYKEIIVMNRRFRRCQDCGKTGKITILK
jgi:hypothetical protein